MTGARILFQCDGAAVPHHLRARQDLSNVLINADDPESGFNLYIAPLEQSVFTQIDEPIYDLLRVAAHVYAADRMVSRGGEADVYQRKWPRELTMCMPVSEPDRWNQDSLRSALRDMLRFLTEDLWDFHFSAYGGKRRVPPLLDAEVTKQYYQQPDCVVLFSGGLDSLVAAVEAVRVRGKRPLLVCHAPEKYLGSRQRDLAAALPERLGWAFPLVPIVAHLKTDDRESSQRSRGFLYATMGAAVALQLGIGPVYLSDNGIVSLGLGLNKSVIGAHASRNTHPKFLELFNRFLTELRGLNQATVENSLWNRTRGEELQILKDAGCPELIRQTISCSRNQRRPREEPQCGFCSQCVDRRFGIRAADLERFDTKYALDIFEDDLPDEGEPRTVPLSYFQRALTCEQSTDVFQEFRELDDCIPSGPNAIRVAAALADLLKRHGQEVHRVMDEEVVRLKHSLTSGEISTNRLVRLVQGGNQHDQDSLQNVFRQSGRVWKIHYAHKLIEIPKSQGLRYLGYLLAHPHQNIEAQALVRWYGSRHASTEREAARKSVWAALNRALKIIEEEHPKLWEHLCGAMDPGGACSYRPKDRIVWLTGPESQEPPSPAP
jgi:7-cyano-7-deazaguanine synthase in queuosine biosynthesis